jgi:hypothetical protein
VEYLSRTSFKPDRNSPENQPCRKTYVLNPDRGDMFIVNVGPTRSQAPLGAARDSLFCAIYPIKHIFGIDVWRYTDCASFYKHITPNGVRSNGTDLRKQYAKATCRGRFSLLTNRLSEKFPRYSNMRSVEPITPNLPFSAYQSLKLIREGNTRFASSIIPVPPIGDRLDILV